jgi:hypothetical protein
MRKPRRDWNVYNSRLNRGLRLLLWHPEWSVDLDALVFSK